MMASTSDPKYFSFTPNQNSSGTCIERRCRLASIRTLLDSLIEFLSLEMVKSSLFWGSILVWVTVPTLCDGFLTPVSNMVSPLKPLRMMPEFDSPDFFHQISNALSDAAVDVPEAGGVSYSKASYYTVLGLYLFSFPGLWSTIKRSTKAKIKRKTYIT